MWTLNGIRLYVQEMSEPAKNIYARIQPLSGGTKLHGFGYESDVFNINAVIVGTTDKEALKALARTKTSYTLVTPYGDITGLYVNSVEPRQRDVISQTMRADLDCTAPVYDVTIELYEED